MHVFPRDDKKMDVENQLGELREFCLVRMGHSA